MWFSISVYSPEKEFFVAVFDVITERKKAEEAQGRLAAIIDSAEDAIIGKDLNGIIQTWNVGAENIFGYKAEEVIGKPISLLIPSGFADEVPEILARIKQGEHIENFETVRMRKDGTIVPVILTFSAIKDTNGKITGASKIAHDITARKRIEEALRESEERYRNLFNAMEEGFCIIEMIFDAEGRPVDYRFLEVNAAFEKQTGLHEAEGKRMRELAPAHEAHWFEIYGKIALTGEPAHFENEARALNRWYDVYAYRVGKPEDRHVAIVFNDISGHKRAVEALRNRTDELETINKELEAFIYSVSHDLRAPLRTMAGFSKILIEDYGNKLENQPKDYLVRINNASEKMTELIDDLLRLSKISRQEITHLWSTSANWLLIIAGLREAHPGRNIEVMIAEGLRATVDPNLIRVVLTNLIENAWKFTSKTADARLELGAFKKEGKTVYFVKDNGAGFDQTSRTRCSARSSGCIRRRSLRVRESVLPSSNALSAATAVRSGQEGSQQRRNGIFYAGIIKCGLSE